MGLPFQLHCLGRPQLISPGGVPVRFRVRKHLALLTYLALEPRVPHRREKLADLLWGNVPPGEGRHSLATAASIIRGKLGRQALEGDRDHLRLSATNLAVDLERLAAGDLFGDDYRPALAVGGFLEDFEVADALEFMLWSDRQRARWLPLVRDALVRLIDRCRRTGDFKQIETLGSSLLEIDELSEDGIRARMEARAFDGDRLTSLKIYEAWKIKLAQELQAVPSPLVEGIAIRLRRRDWEGVTSNIPTVPTDQWRGRPFVGRGSEYRALYEGWEKTIKRYPHHALVLGDSGVGKSTLLERVVTAAGLEGAAISRVSCYELEREIPYAAIGGLVAGLLDRPGASGTPPEWLAELSRTVPEIRRRFPTIPDPIETQGETARLRLTEAAQQLALSIAEEHPVILVIDDVHLADDASLAVLHLLMRRTLDQRIMVLLAARPAELGQSPHAAWLRDGHEQLRMQILDLQPMTARESEELLVSLLSDDPIQPSAAARRALLHSAAGFPMVLEYLVNDWRSNGDQCLALSIGAMTEEPRTGIAPNQTYHLIVQRIVQSLDPSVRNVLTMASVLGARVNDIDMYRLADVSVGQTMSALGKLTDIRILRDGGKGLEFCNELVRGEAYLGIPSPVRKVVHRAIAEQLLSREVRGGIIPGLEIAWHCIRGGMLGTATPYLLSGAREAIRRGAPHEAERALETALGHLEEPARTDALILLAESLYEQGRWEDVLKVLSESRISSADPRSSVSYVLATECRRRLNAIRPDELDSVVNRTLLISEGDPNTRTRVKAIVSLAYLIVYTPVHARSLKMMSIINLLEERDLSDEDSASVAVASAILHYHRGEIQEAVIKLRAAASRMERYGVNNTVGISVYEALGNINSASGNYKDAAKHNLRAFELTKYIGNDRASSRVATNLTMCFARLGEYRKAIEWLEAAMAFDSHRATDDLSHCLYYGVVSNAMLGRSDEGKRLAMKLEVIADSAEGLRLRQNTNLYLADAFRILGASNNALLRARIATSGHMKDLQSPNSAGLYSRWLASVAIVDKLEKRAEPLLKSLAMGRELYDRADKTEVLCAMNWFDCQLGRPDKEVKERLRAEFAELPDSIGSFLERLGFYQPS